MPRIIRRHRNRKPDDKGDRRLIGGVRWRIPKGSIQVESDYAVRFDRIERVFREQEKLPKPLILDDSQAWLPVASHAAEYIRLGADRIPMPELDAIFDSFWDHSAVRLLNSLLIESEAASPNGIVNDLTYDHVMGLFDMLVEAFPSVPWELPRRQQKEILAFHESTAREAIRKYAQASNAQPPNENLPLVSGTFHEALTAYRKDRQKSFEMPGGEITQSGHAALSLVDGLIERHADMPLYLLDFSRCNELFAYWINRPNCLKKKGAKDPNVPLSRKTCRNHVVELDLFFKWLHLSSQFTWRKPTDYPDINRSVRELPGDRKSLTKMEKRTFQMDELRLLYRHATQFERLLLVWCLNTSHGAGELGRVEWEDLYLRQPHPWTLQGMKIDGDKSDSWCGLLRPKTDVLGWWWLFPETVELLNWWRGECASKFQRVPVTGDRVVITPKGQSLYRDTTKNAQTGFANLWTRLLKRVEKHGETISFLPFGTLRDQLANWLGGEQNQAVLASVALAHGIPHKGDKLLYQHYSNKPWQAFFDAQRQWREHLQPMFSETPSVLD